MRVVRRGEFVLLQRVFDEGSGRLSWAGKSAYLHGAFAWIAGRTRGSSPARGRGKST